MTFRLKASKAMVILQKFYSEYLKLVFILKMIVIWLKLHLF
jgi:hypothetical protein